MMRFNRGLAAAAASTILLCSSIAGRGEDNARVPAAPLVVAQFFGTPPADVGSSRGPDEATLLIRIEKLESQIRQMNGQIEQMQNENHRLEEQLRKFQQDVDFRLQESSGRPKPQKRGETDPTAPTQTAVIGNDQASQTPSTAPQRPNRHGDAFDPSLEPDAPGAPRNLGSPTANLRDQHPALEAHDPAAPLDLSSSPGKSPRPLSPETPANPPQTTTPGGTVIANNPQTSPPINPVKEEFEVAMGYLKQKDFEAAEKGFAAFLQKNPKTRYSAEAIYYLGETYYQRGRQREAAEQYLKISSDYAGWSRAPEALVRLGQSLNAIGAKEQACASFGEVGRRYPNAPAAVKAAAEREAKRVQC
jgi:tol-pal system protein YbgF